MRGTLRLTSATNGPGMPEEIASNLFTAFKTKKQGGTGLGLSIVKHIAQIHHGNVEVESTPGKGSTFTIILPMVQSEAATEDLA